MFPRIDNYSENAVYKKTYNKLCRTVNTIQMFDSIVKPRKQIFNVKHKEMIIDMRYIDIDKIQIFGVIYNLRVISYKICKIVSNKIYIEQFIITIDKDGPNTDINGDIIKEVELLK